MDIDKDAVLSGIRHLAHQGKISQSEVIKAHQEGQQGEPQEGGIEHFHHVALSRILSFVGGGIVFAGIVVFVAQFFEDLGTIARLLVTLGSGVGAFVVAVLLGLYKRFGHVSQAFYLIAALVFPLGLFVLFLDVLDMHDISLVNVLVSLVLSALFAVSYFVIKRNQLFVVFVTLFVLWFLYAFLVAFLPDSFRSETLFDIYAYSTVAVGVALTLIGFAFRISSLARLTPIYYSLGSIATLGATLALGGVWDVLFAGLIFSVFFLSIYVNSRTFLVFGALFLMGYIIKITAEYFSDTVGWPIALVIAGLALIGVGYLAFVLHGRYLTKQARILPKRDLT